MRKNKITQQDYLKAHRKASREEEIALHGKSIRRSAVHRSKKIYNRKRMKAGMKILPFSFLFNSSTHIMTFNYLCDKAYNEYHNLNKVNLISIILSL